MPKAIRATLMLTLLMSTGAALAGHHADPLPAAARYVANVADDAKDQSRVGSPISAPSCSTDFGPGDPIYFKLADGRCSGD